MQKIIAQTTAHLKDLINEEIKINGFECNLNHIDISLIDDLSNLFAYSCFNGDISKWDVSHVKNMSGMFYNSKFNGDISQWNVSQVENMKDMFGHSIFNGDISLWNTSKVKNMERMFLDSKFNGDLTEWKPYNVNNYKNMFDDCPTLIPYWAECKNATTRIHAIDNYVLYEKLNNNISNKEYDKKNPSNKKKI